MTVPWMLERDAGTCVGHPRSWCGVLLRRDRGSSRWLRSSRLTVMLGDTKASPSPPWHAGCKILGSWCWNPADDGDHAELHDDGLGKKRVIHTAQGEIRWIVEHWPGPGILAIISKRCFWEMVA